MNIKSNEIDNITAYSTNYENLNSSNKEVNNTNYILGTGDVLKIDFLGLSFYDGNFTIDPQGEINLPEIGTIEAKGKTLKELNFFIKEKYKEFVIEPTLEIEVLEYRPISIYLSGEVREPGLYTLPFNFNGVPGFPKLYDALKLGGGFNNKANLKNIQVVRINSASQGGGKIKANIDLISLFDNGDQSVNINLHDGDVIIIPKSEETIKDQILKINRTNISPEQITVYVTGNAINPGPQNLKKGTSLVQAISSSGGKKLFTGKIEFIRFNYDGTTSKEIFAYNPNAKINSRNNPILMNGDLINIKRTPVGATAEFAGEIASPILSLYGLYQLVPTLFQ